MIKDKAKSVVVGGFTVGSCHRCGGGEGDMVVSWKAAL